MRRDPSLSMQSLSRRDFLKFSALAAASAGTILHNRCDRNEKISIDTIRLDRFGGLKSVSFDATGFFRVEKGDRWWFVTPDGAAFLSFGLNHPDKEYLLQSYNIDFWRKQFGFQDPSEQAFREEFINKVMKDLKAFGMNTIGTHARKEFYGKLTVPYLQGLFFVRTSYWLSPTVHEFSDVFSTTFQKRCEQVVRRLVMPRKDDPFLIGYTFTDCPILTDLDADTRGERPWGKPTPPWGLPSQPDMPTWPRALRNLGSNAPGKNVFIELILERYPSIRAFNHVYKTRFSSFDALLNTENWSPVVKTAGIDDRDDNNAFLMRILEQYYTVACMTIRKLDPNHLIFGDILNANTGTHDDIVSLVSRYTDVITYQFYGRYDEQKAILDRWSKLSGKPLFHADSCFSVPYQEMPTPLGVICPDQETRAQSFLDFASRAFSRPDFIGWHWCGWMDAWASWRKLRQHSGLQDPFGRYHHPMPETMAQFGSMLYDYGLGRKDPEKERSTR